MRSVRSLALGVSLALVVLPGGTLAAPATVRVSVSSDGIEANCGSWNAVVSAATRVVAFVSCASNLVPRDTNGAEDVFVRDLSSGATTRVSVASNGTEADADSGGVFGEFSPVSISDDGRYVTFASTATNLVSGDTNAAADVFMHDRVTAETTRASVGGTARQADGYSQWPSLSGNGRYVAFESVATNLVRGDTNDKPDVFVRDLLAGRTERVSVRSDERQVLAASGRPDISSRGRSVAFLSISGGLVRHDTNHSWDVFVHDRASDRTTRVSVSTAGRQGNDHSDWPTISGSGRIVAFVSWATNFAPTLNGGASDVFAHDRRTGVTTIVSARSDGRAGNDQSTGPAVSRGGRWVTFDSAATNLVSADTGGHNHVYLHDRRTGETVLVTVDRRGGPAAGDSSDAALSPGGGWIAFGSDAPTLVWHDTNDASDVFLRALDAAVGGRGR